MLDLDDSDLRQMRMCLIKLRVCDLNDIQINFMTYDIDDVLYKKLSCISMDHICIKSAQIEKKS